jgi:hypothetical protein
MNRIRKRALLSFAALAVVMTAHAAQLGPASVRVAPIVLRPHGFEPAKLEIGSGKILIAVYNRTGLAEINLRIERELGGEHIKEETVKAGRRHWKTMMELAPGSYVVRETKHPNWVCRLSVVTGRN